MDFKAFKKILVYVFLPAAVLLVFIGSYFRLLDNYELDILDFRFCLRGRIEATDKVVIIEIGDDTVQKLGRFPFDRSYDATLVKAFSEGGAKAIVFDIVFSEPHENDNELAEAIREAGNVYLPFVFELDYVKKDKIINALGYNTKSLPDFTAYSGGTGHINIIPDADGKFRKVPLYIKYKDELYPYISFSAACDYLGISEENIRLTPGNLICGRNIRVPLDDNSNVIINYSGAWGQSYKHYSYVDVLQSYIAELSGEKAVLDLSIFEDKICIIGLTAAGTADLHPSPLEPLYPAVGVLADVFNSVLNNNFIVRVPRGANLAILGFLFSLIMIASLKMRPLKGFFTLLTTAVIFVLAGILLFSFYGVWVDIFYPVFTIVIAYLFTTLGKYVMEWKKTFIMDNELQIAKKIQESFLPKTLLSVRGVEIDAAMFPARQVGGDLYDFFDFGNSKFGVMVGDVSGKGVPASLFMALVLGTFKAFAAPQIPPHEALSHLNTKIIQESSTNLFVTVFYSVFDIRNKTLKYANGGHLPLLYLPKERPAVFLDVENGAPLGLLEGPYSGSEININEGDAFVFYTDGITEAVSPRGEMYGRERLISIAERNREYSANIILKRITEDVGRFQPKSKQHDDITLIVIKIGGRDFIGYPSATKETGLTKETK